MFKNILSLVVVLSLISGAYVFYQQNGFGRLADAILDNAIITYVEYDLDVTSSADCTKFEEFNSRNQTCTLTCDNAEDCESKRLQINAIIDRRVEEYLANKEPLVADIIDEVPEATGTNIVQYDITRFPYQLVAGQQTEYDVFLLDTINTITPEDILERGIVTDFFIYKDDSNDHGAFVQPNYLYTEFEVHFNQEMFNNGYKDITSIMVHEMMHVISALEVDIVEEADDCQTFYADGACYSQDSLMNRFYQAFYNGQVDVDSRDNYVTDYAMTDTEEDLADSFSAFVFNETYTTNSVVQQKINFFNDYPELVEIRETVNREYAGFLRNRVMFAEV